MTRGKTQSRENDRSAIVTVVTEDHLPFARTLVRMATDHSWEGQCVVVLVDCDPECAELPNGCLVLPWDRLLSQDNREFLLKRYDIAEVCYAVKPIAIDHLLSNGFDRAHYLDSDIGVFDSLAGVDTSLKACSIQLTPHCLEDLPLDGKVPDQLTLLRAGVFNAGYVGVRSTPVGHCFLRWWADTTRRFGYVDPYLGMLGDQRWLDLVPAKFVEVRILRDKGLNVGYWNLHERQLRFDGNAYLVDESALVFFHFSGFEPHTPSVLSKFQDRHRVEAGGALSRISSEYAKAVIASGYQGRTYPRWAPGNRRFELLKRVREKLILMTIPSFK